MIKKILPAAFCLCLPRGYADQKVQTHYNSLVSLQVCAPDEHKPEIPHHELPQDDPFRNHLLVLRPSGNFDYRAPKAYELSSALFKRLGTTSYSSWIMNLRIIRKTENELEALQIPPLMFLYFLFCNETKTAYMHHFRSAGGRLAWYQFRRRLGNHLEKAVSETPPLIPGFCYALSLNCPQVERLINEKRWGEFIDLVFETRMKHFNIK